MRLAIHQPYFFPYLGYFQLIDSVDTFVFLDDANFITRGWVNRNRIMVNGAAMLFTLPLRKASQSVPINRTMVDLAGFPEWRRRFRETLRRNYAASPQLGDVLALVDHVLAAAPEGLAPLARRSVELSCSYLGIDTPLQVASADYPSSGARSVDRIIEICHAAGASMYVNAPGGRHLYQPDRFHREDLGLAFLEPRLDPYPQPGGAFVPRLSILDVMLRLGRREASAMAARHSSHE